MSIYVITSEIENKMNRKKFCRPLKIFMFVRQRDIREQRFFFFKKIKHCTVPLRLDYEPISHSSHCRIRGLGRDRTSYVEHVFNVFFFLNRELKWVFRVKGSNNPFTY